MPGNEDCGKAVGSIDASQTQLETFIMPSMEKILMPRMPLKAVGASLAMTLLCSCTSAVYDVRQIQQPIVLNGNPFLAPATVSSMQLAKVDTYTATVSRSEMTASVGNTTSTSVALANQAQLNAFQEIGGQPNRTICDVSLDADYLAINGLFLLGEKISIQAAGDVAKFEYPVEKPVH